MIERSYNNHFKDKIIRCADCGNNFVLTAGEQAFFNSKRPPLSEPKRCKACRDYRRQTIHRTDADFDHVLNEAKREIDRDG